MSTIVIIGTGLAGYMLAKEIRKLDTQAKLILFTEREGNFYSKPQLSTAFTMKKSAEQLVTNTAEAMAEQLNATIMTHTKVEKIDPAQRKVFYQGAELSYDKLVLATGSQVIAPPLLGNAATEILSVNDLEDYALFRQEIQGKKRIAILGAGLVGCEFANDLSNAGHDVTVIAPASYPVDRLLTETIGKHLQQALASNGVQWRLQTLPQQVNKHDNEYLIKCDQGDVVHADIVLSAIGLIPHAGLARDAGIRVNQGVVVNRQLCSSDPHIFALGDCAEVDGLVLFFIAPLLQCSRALAKTLTGEPTAVVYPAMPVALKTPVCPIVVQPPPPGIAGHWHEESFDDGFKAVFHGEDKAIYGFVLSGKLLKECMALQKQVVGVNPAN